MSRLVGYSARVSGDGTPYVRVSVQGLGGAFRVADATAWHASAYMRRIANELLAVADELDVNYPRPEPE